MIEKNKKQKEIYVEKKLNFFSKFVSGFKQRKLEKIEYLKLLSSLRETSQININELVSDLRYFKPTFWNRFIGRLRGVQVCMCIVHYPQNVDIVRYFKMPKPFVVDIHHNLYLFSPKAFRYINGIPKLEFYANIPFALIHNVIEKYEPPSLDSDAFSSVQKSKFIQDAVTVNDDNQFGALQIAVIVVCGLAFIIGIINFVVISGLDKKITAIAGG